MIKNMREDGEFGDGVTVVTNPVSRVTAEKSEAVGHMAWVVGDVRYCRDFADWVNVYEAGADPQMGSVGIDRFVCCVHAEDAEKARLIAAAPEMLEALKAIYRHVDDPAHYDRHVDAICESAIAKAEGRS